MGSTVAATPYDFIALDDVAAGALAATRLLELGHRRILVIGGRRGVSSHVLRLKGCAKAFQRRDIRLDERQVRFANFTAEQAYEETRQAMTSTAPPTAIISFSNFMTLGVIRALTDLDRKCPDEVSLIGVDDLDWSDLMRLQPTLIAQPIEEMTRAAIGALLLQVEGGAAERSTHLISTETDRALVVRTARCSTRPLSRRFSLIRRWVSRT